MKKVLEGSHAVSEAVRLARAEVISAYPITPQTHIVELLSEYCSNGTMKAKFLRVESEHSAMAALIGAASVGVRTFTATSSQGLALMHELLHWASGARLPIVMAEVNRALGPGWNIWTEQTDSLAQRDTGWVQIYCEDAQEALDSTLLAYRIAESVFLPVMVVLDAFFLSHTYEPVDVPEQDQVDNFLPPLEPAFKLDTANPCALNQLAPPSIYMEMRRDIERAMERVEANFSGWCQDFHRVFERRYDAVERVRCDDADVILVSSGTVTSTARLVVEELRKDGHKVGLLKAKLFRPFPAEAIRRSLQSASRVAVIDRNISFGSGGIFAREIQAALCGMEVRPMVFSYVAGLGGRDITPSTIHEIYRRTVEATEPEVRSVWIGLDPHTA